MNDIAEQRELLQAMNQLNGPLPVYCDRVLRQALQALNRYDAVASETALCCDGDEDQDVRQLYACLRKLIVDGFAEGTGDLRMPAGPRYTACRITTLGLQSSTNS